MGWELLGQILETGSVVVASGTAIWGIKAWRHEQIGRRQMEVAEEALAGLYEAAAAIQAIRVPFGPGGEGSTRKPEPGESPQETERLNTAFTTFERFNKHSEALNVIHAKRFRVMALMGRDAGEPFNDIHRILLKIAVAARQHYRFIKRGDVNARLLSQAQADAEAERLDRINTVLFLGSEPDEITDSLTKCIADADRIIGQYIATGDRLKSLKTWWNKTTAQAAKAEI